MKDYLKYVQLGYEVKIVKKSSMPNYRVSNDVNLTDAYRMHINQWCDDLFGISYQYIIPKGEIVIHNNRIYINEEDYMVLKNDDKFNV